MILITTLARALANSMMFVGRQARPMSEYEAMTELCHEAQPEAAEFVTLHGVRTDDLFWEVDSVLTILPGIGSLEPFSRIYLKPEEGPWIVLS